MLRQIKISSLAGFLGALHMLMYMMNVQEGANIRSFPNVFNHVIPPLPPKEHLHLERPWNVGTGSLQTPLS